MYNNLGWFDTGLFVILWLLPILVVAAGIIFLLVQVISVLIRYVRSGEVRRRREERGRTKALGEILKIHRIRCGMTPEFVAEAVGVSRRAVFRWEKGTCVLNAANLRPLAELYGVTMEELQERKAQ